MALSYAAKLTVRAYSWLTGTNRIPMRCDADADAPTAARRRSILRGTAPCSPRREEAFLGDHQMIGETGARVDRPRCLTQRGCRSAGAATSAALCEATGQPAKGEARPLLVSSRGPVRRGFVASASVPRSRPRETTRAPAAPGPVCVPASGRN